MKEPREFREALTFLRISWNFRSKNGADPDRLTNALLMTILTQTFLPFVGGHFMALTLLSAWHVKKL